MRTAYGHIEPYSTFYLDVDGPHQLYVEQCGNPDAPPVVVLHGGPGGAINPTMRRFFHPRRWRTVLFDQRGCGRSHPLASLDNNTTWALVDDMERLRKQLNISQWVLFGGSWGATLAVAYAETHPERVSGLILRAVFLISPWEIDWFYGGGAGAMLPEAWTAFLAHLPLEERERPLEAYYARLTSDDAQIRQEAAFAWTAWENAAIGRRSAPAQRTHARRISGASLTNGTHARGAGGPTTPPGRAVPAAEALARLECHYCLHGGFLERPTQLLDDASRFADKPTYIVQGRDDLVTPPITAWRLSQTNPDTELILVDGAGHSASDPGIMNALLDCTDAMAARLAAH